MMAVLAKEVRHSVMGDYCALTSRFVCCAVSALHAAAAGGVNRRHDAVTEAQVHIALLILLSYSAAAFHKCTGFVCKPVGCQGPLDNH
jgi:hypothetical protein